jgi:hypothetical protein
MKQNKIKPYNLPYLHNYKYSLGFSRWVFESQQPLCITDDYYEKLSKELIIDGSNFILFFILMPWVVQNLKGKKAYPADYDRKTIAKQHWFQQLDLP